ncbi:MAG: GNAT family N-acetyltransferase [bacterium]|nr:GNAT family N-acetyltransferase [bacterium]
MITYRLANISDVDKLVELRINQLKDEGAIETLELKPYLKEYYTTNLNNKSFISYLAIDNDEIIATSGLTITHKPPYYKCPTGKIGLLSSMYTNPNYRRQGIARHLLDLIIGIAKENGCGIIHITASDMGVKLYEAYGFSHNNNFMQYFIK